MGSVCLYIYWKQNANCRMSMQYKQNMVDVLHSASSAPLILISLHTCHTKFWNFLFVDLRQSLVNVISSHFFPIYRLRFTS
jgi:hypothetical protein